MSDFYNPCHLLSMRDLENKEPEIFMVDGNRTGGKTFAFKSLLIRKFIKKKGKFAILVRRSAQLDAVHEAFFKDIGEIKFPKHIMDAEWCLKGICKELFFDGESCGYAIGMWNRDIIKQNSSMFVDVNYMFFDEFQSESGGYLRDEVGALMSIHTSVARGGGKHTRHVPVYMCSNSVSSINPYYTALGIDKRLKPDTKFLRGNGWVLERTFIKSAAEAISESGFARAFGNTKQMQFAVGNTYLLDSIAFIAKMGGIKRPIANLLHRGQKYGIWYCVDSNDYLVSVKSDKSYPVNIAFSLSEHNEGSRLVKATIYARTLARAFNDGNVFFENARCKDAFLDVIGYTQTQKMK